MYYLSPNPEHLRLTPRDWAGVAAVGLVLGWVCRGYSRGAKSSSRESESAGVNYYPWILYGMGCYGLFWLPGSGIFLAHALQCVCMLILTVRVPRVAVPRTEPDGRGPVCLPPTRLCLAGGRGLGAAVPPSLGSRGPGRVRGCLPRG